MVGKQAINPDPPELKDGTNLQLLSRIQGSGMPDNPSSLLSRLEDKPALLSRLQEDKPALLSRLQDEPAPLSHRLDERTLLNRLQDKPTLLSRLQDSNVNLEPFNRTSFTASNLKLTSSEGETSPGMKLLTTLGVSAREDALDLVLPQESPPSA